MYITVYGGAAGGDQPAYVEAAAALGTYIAQEGHTLVYGGGAVGMMGAVANAALAAGGRVIGIIPHFMVEREWAHKGVSEMIYTDTMAQRKTLLIEKGEAFIAMPGGTGTLEEISELISCVSLELKKAPAMLLNTQGYYDTLGKVFQEMVDHQFLDEPVRQKILMPRDVSEIHDILSTWEAD